ncbi:MAG: glycogen synthase [Clostridia bacterium]|nr:glycogen synthase [Clostridia bacterium]
MKILFVSSEALPYSSSGGLGDVSAALPKEISRSAGTDIRVILPLYRDIKERFTGQLEFMGQISVRLSWRNLYCGIYTAINDNVKYYFIDNEYYFFRRMLYGEYDDGERFAFFSKAILDVLPLIDFFPDILHANDWQTAASVIYLKTLYSSIAEYNKIKCVFTIHNLDYQGCINISAFYDVFGFPQNAMEQVCLGGGINLVNGAIHYTDIITTVSPTYAEEIRRSEFSGELFGVINDNYNKLYGIINGIDTDYYSPEKDDDITANFSSSNISGKETDKRLLQGLCGLPIKEDIPVFCLVSRLTGHKGIDLVTAILDILLEKELQIIILGTGEKRYEEYLLNKAKQYSGRLSVNIKYDKSFSKKIYAGSDIFLMPSLREPCGVAQMIASRYGTVPVVRKTGGLADTISESEDNKNGFVFENYDAGELLRAIERAISEYSNVEKWVNLVRRVMRVDFSWKSSAEKYLQIYEKIL